MYNIKLNNDMELQLSNESNNSIIRLVDSSDHEVVTEGIVDEAELVDFLCKFLK